MSGIAGVMTRNGDAPPSRLLQAMTAVLTHRGADGEGHYRAGDCGMVETRLFDEAGAEPRHIVRMTWYLLDKREYVARGREVGQAYREVLGSEYGIAMTAVQVAGLIEDRAKVEIEVTAVVPARD